MKKCASFCPTLYQRDAEIYVIQRIEQQTSVTENHPFVCLFVCQFVRPSVRLLSDG